MRLIQALAISVPAWILCYFLLADDVLWVDEWPHLILLLGFVVCTAFASTLAFLRCDMRISLSRSQAGSVPERSGTRANIAFLLTGLALGLFPTLIWKAKVNRQYDEARFLDRGVPVIGVYEDISPGDKLAVLNMALMDILSENLTDLHFRPEEIHKLMGAKAVNFIPARTPVVASQIEVNFQPPEPERNDRATSLRDLRL